MISAWRFFNDRQALLFYMEQEPVDPAAPARLPGYAGELPLALRRISLYTWGVSDKGLF
jgi:hypothetical protein